MQKISPYIKSFTLSFMSVSLLLMLASTPVSVASDHSDSPTVKLTENKNGDIADLYVFREGDQSGNTADNSKLVFILTVNGLAVAGTGHEFSTDKQYDIKVARDRNNLAATSKTLSFRFGALSGDGRQKIWLNGKFAGWTTAFNTTPTSAMVDLNGSMAKVFAGDTDDPFFFDLRIIGPNGEDPSPTGMPTPADTFAGSNASSIVVSVPVAWFQTAAQEKNFFSWTTVAK